MRMISLDLSSTMVPISAWLGAKGDIHPKLGPAVSRAAQAAVAPVCNCVLTYFPGVFEVTLPLEILISTLLRSHLLWEASFDSLVSSLTPRASNKLKQEFFLSQNPWTRCHKYIYFCAPAGLESNQFYCPDISKLLPTWTDSSSAPTGQL